MERNDETKRNNRSSKSHKLFLNFHFTLLYIQSINAWRFYIAYAIAWMLFYYCALERAYDYTTFLSEDIRITSREIYFHCEAVPFRY